jgi:transaldolase/glucose-6-phosphate isomerase
MSILEDLSDIGQSIWYDYIRRSFIVSGELQALVDHGLRGVTSNPSIFEKAIIGSADYDEELKQLMEEGKNTQDIYEALALKDIGMASAILWPVHEATSGKDGYVSLEVDPSLAHDTPATISEAKRLFEALACPNVMIKVPATPAGILAIPDLIGSGVNVNVTLLFSTAYYKQVAEAYLKGLEMLADKGPSVKGGQRLDQVSSVASFFVSRVDSAVDQRLKAKGNKDLLGKIAIANAKAAFVQFKDIFSGSRWEKLAGKGARVQRLLWASTGTKNPLYPDTLYVDQLIGPNTVNTVPPATLDRFVDHGEVETTLSKGIEEAEDQLSQLEALDIDLNAVTQRLLNEGVKAFAKSFESLMRGISEKMDRLKAGKQDSVEYLGSFRSAVDENSKSLRDEKIMHRIWAHDYTVWKDDPTEIANRLGWLHSPEVMMDAIPEITAFVEEVRKAGYTHALLLGMGGSSLAPEMFRLTFGVREGYLDLAVLDSTDPGAVSAYAEKLDPKKILLIVSTKSGGTVETFSFMKYFYNQVSDAVGLENAGEHFVAITDPGSGLERTAKELKFRKIFLNDPNIGGRYSALSYFGLVPAALIGMDVPLLLERAATMACNSEGCNCPVGGNNAPARLGAMIGELANEGLDKLTLITTPSTAHFGAWVEQLIAESTGKEGKGILPVNGEMLGSPEIYAGDRFFVCLELENEKTDGIKLKVFEADGHPAVHINLKDLYDLGGECFRWEMATAVAGHVMGINPFDQPNVESAKVLARQMVAAYQKEGKLPETEANLEKSGIQVYGDISAHSPVEALENFLAGANKGEDESAGRSYVAIQAYVKPTHESDGELQALRTKIQFNHRLATTVGYGPRFLHSTGQLHKGDAGHGLFIQITADMPEDLPIPDQAGKDASSISFGVLKTAQVLGDSQALEDAGRKVIRFHLGKDIVGGLRHLTQAIG